MDPKRPHAHVPGMTLPSPRTPDPATAPGLRWGLLGAGGIASQMAFALRGTTQEVVAVGSRDEQRAQAFVAEHASDTRAHGNYASLVADPDVDVVYVATPHSEHLEHALLAIAAGKHVLVEKPMAPTADEARQIVAAAREAGVFCMEAMWTRFLPHIDVLRQVLELGLLGEVSTVLADHGIRLWPDGPQRLSDPALAGGAMLDLGIYPLSFASLALGGLERVAGLGDLTDLGVDRRFAFVAQGPGGAVASLSTDMSASTPTTASVNGTWARLELETMFYMPTTMRLVGADGVVLDTMTGDPIEQHRGLRHEAVEVALRVAAGETESPVMPLEETVAILTVMDELLGSLRR
ncbi:Gfo/Idh/MocA family oxidoreductase [Janibacter sp. DB-40]|uniref:Gfo/Idh/MocA family protein n=1 Tax=Janibacter sp. DB-40 TaxID=3028808 RepID=UPI002405211C|nr:Gfo/Idh/MocA family oxidoreductase [Janibacter sp. DB-40]